MRILALAAFALALVPALPATAAQQASQSLPQQGQAAMQNGPMTGLPGNLPSVSGARGPRILGAIHPA